MTAGVYEGGMLMAGTGQMIGESVLILYNDPAPHSVLSLGQTDRQTDRRTPDRADIVQRPRSTQRPVTRTDRQTDRRTPDRADIVQRPRCTQRPVTRTDRQTDGQTDTGPC